MLGCDVVMFKNKNKVGLRQFCIRDLTSKRCPTTLQDSNYNDANSQMSALFFILATINLTQYCDWEHM